tara:strand:- start:306 stop:488 length:183 start_codon:yes stop_codon:yes gene_type:complete
MEIELLKDYTTGQGKSLKSGDKLDCDRATYLELLEKGSCKPLKGDKNKFKSKNKKDVITK